MSDCVHETPSEWLTSTVDYLYASPKNIFLLELLVFVLYLHLATRKAILLVIVISFSFFSICMLHVIHIYV